MNSVKVSDWRMFSGKPVLVQTLRKPACLSPLDCSAELRADADQQTGGYGLASMVLPDLVRARARQETQVPVMYTGHVSKPEGSATGSIA